MNILEQTEALKDMPDAALIQQMKMPTGQIAPIFITSELKRRKRMRDEYARREAADTPTVAEEVVMAAGMPSGGIADAARALAPKTDMGQNTGMAEMAPRAATRAPQPMASGGIVGMRQGGKLVKVGRASFYAFPDGEVFFEKPDGSREAVTDPRVLGVVRTQANVGPERQESAAPLGSEILQEAAPQRPSLDSAISSDSPFSPISAEVTDPRPATPSNLGMGGERPATLTDATQPAIDQQQILLDAISPAFDTFGGEPLARAEERSNLSGPSISDVSPTVPTLSEMEKARLATEFTQQQELARAIRDQQEQGIASLNPPSADLGQYENRDAIESFNKRTFGKPMTPADKAEERLLMSNMNIPPDSPFAEFAGVDNPETQLIYEGSGKDYMDESEDFYDDISKNLLPPQASSSAERGFDPLAPLGQERAARAVLAQQAGLEALRKTQPNVDAGTDPKFGDTMGLQEVLASDFDPVSAASSAPAANKESNIQKAVSDLGLAPITRDGEEYFISPAGMVFKQEGDDLVPVAGGEAMQAMDVAQRQGEDFSVSPMGMIPIGSRDVDPNTGLIDPDSPFVPASLDASGAKTPQFLTDALGPGSTISSLLNVQEGAAPVTKVDETKTRVAPASPAEGVVGFGAQPRYDVDQLPGPIGAGTATDPITMGDAPVGIEAARPKAAPVALKAERDAAKLSAPDGGGITTVSTKAINDAAKSTGLGVDAWLSIAKGGAAVAASKNPTLLGALGEGAGVAASSLMAQRASDKAASLKQDQIDATLEAARIRAAAAGRAKTMAPPTGSVLFTAAREDLANAKYKLDQLNSAKSRTKKTSEWKLAKARVEDEIKLLQSKIDTLTYGGSVASAGGTDNPKNYDVS